VKQYLSESFKSSESLHNLIPYPVLQHNNPNNSSNINNTNSMLASKSQPATTCNSPVVRTSSTKLLNHHVTAKNGNLLSQSANEMLHVQSLEYSNSGHSTSNNSFPFLLQHRYVAAASPHSEVASSAMSPTISSVATSASEVCWISNIFNRSF
jgi:hypothetical protein